MIQAGTIDTSAEELRTYEARLATFKSWPKDLNLKKEDMSRCGWYSLGAGDISACAFCGIVVYNLDKEQSAWDLHYKKAPNCPFLKKASQQDAKKKDDHVVLIKPFHDRIEIIKSSHTQVDGVDFILAIASVYGLYCFACYLFGK